MCNIENRHQLCKKCFRPEDACYRLRINPPPSKGCDGFVNPEHATLLKRIFSKVQAADYDGSWMGDDACLAYLIAVGAGPWKIKRRESVQSDAIDWFCGQRVDDMSELDVKDIVNVFPFAWQNAFLRNMVISLQERDLRFYSLCNHFMRVYPYHDAENAEWEACIAQFFDMAGAKNKAGAKVLWLFVRDYLLLPAFPIDRWVKRALEEYNLPIDPWYITRACLVADVDPNRLNRSFFTAKGENPDWSELSRP